MLLKDKLSLVISSCEAYSDLWDNHIALLRENWADRSIDAVIVTDKKHNSPYSDVEVFSSGESMEMPQRLSEYAKKCKTDYLLITLDDYYVDRPIDNEKILRAICIMEKYELDYFRFWPYPHEKKRIEGVEKAFWIELEGNYKVNLYPAIWRKDFLLQTVKEPLSAWKYEVSLTEIARSLMAKCGYSVNGEYHIVDVIRKGKMLHPAKRFLDSKGMILNRELISWKQEVKLRVLYYGKEIIPKPILRFIKKQIVNSGHKFFSDGI